jgi:streptogramin lyase
MQRFISFLVVMMLFIVVAAPLWADDPPPLVITTSTLPNGDVNAPYSLQLQATGGVPPYTWSIPGGTLPAGITLDPVSGVLSGTPNTKGSTTFTVKALDVNASAASKRFTLDIFQGDVLEVWRQVESGAGYASTNGIAVDKDGFLYTAGKFYDSTFPSIYKITKNDPDGNLVWTRTYGNGGFATPSSLVLDNEGSVYVTGSPLTIKYDTNGTELWRQPFPAAARDIAVASDGKVMVTGIDDNFNVFFVTYDSSGNETGRTVDNLGITAYSLGIAVDGSGNAYVSGFTHKDEYMTAGLDICFLRKYDPSGSLVWGRQGGDRTDCDKVTIGDNGYIYVTGSKYHNNSSTDSDFLTLKYDAEGTLIWGKVYVTPYYANSRDVVTDAKGNVYVTGSEGDISTIKFDDALKILWSTYAGLGGFAHGNAIALAPDGSVYVAGSAQEDLGAEYSSFIVKYRQRLVINTETAPLLLTGIAYQLQFKAENGVVPYAWSVGSGTLPDGLSINHQTGELAGVPLAEGTFPFSIRVTDAAGSTASKSFTITTSDIIFTTEALPPASIGTPYQQQIVAQCATPITWSVGSGALPSGLSLAASGILSGTPSKLETANFTLLATSVAGKTGSKAFSIPVYTPIFIIPEILPDGVLNGGYIQTFIATGGSNNYSWAVDSGALPPGLTFGPVYLNPNVGKLSGVPIVNGTYTFTIKVTDSSGLVFTKTYSMTIGTVVFYTNSLPKGSLGSSYSTQIQAMGGTSPYTYSLISGTLPGGLFFQSNGTISGTPTTFGQFPLTVQAQDSAGVTCAKNFTLTIRSCKIITVTFISHVLCLAHGHFSNCTEV